MAYVVGSSPKVPAKASLKFPNPRKRVTLTRAQSLQDVCSPVRLRVPLCDALLKVGGLEAPAACAPGVVFWGGGRQGQIRDPLPRSHQTHRHHPRDQDYQGHRPRMIEHPQSSLTQPHKL